MPTTLPPCSAEIDRLLPTMPRAAIIAKSLNDRGAMILTRSMEEACELSNRIAPDVSGGHRRTSQMGAAVAPRRCHLPGAYTSESLGHYCAGPNHVLPTSGTARFSSPLGVYDFQKRGYSLIEVSQAGAQTLGPVAAELAYGEGLQGSTGQQRMHLNDVPPMRGATTG